MPNRWVVHVSSGWVVGWHGEVPYDPSLSIRSTAPNPAEQTATVSVDVDSQFLGLGDDELYASHELAWLDEGLAVFVSHDLNAYGGSTRLITSDGVESIHRRALKSKERMHLLLEGSVLTTPDASFKHTFAISNLDSPDGEYRVRIRTSIAEDGGLGPKPPRTVVHRIAKDTGQSEIISEGKGPGWALFGPQGALFVETGGSVRRWSDAADDSPEATLEGLHLTMPIPTQPCDSCG